jgi:hypothetical protein
MFKQNFNNIQVQNTIFSTIKNNHTKEKFYDNSEINDFFKKLSESMNLSSSELLVKNNTVVTSPTFKNKFGTFIYNKTGIRLGQIAINEFLTLSAKDGNLTLENLQSETKNLFGALKSDVKRVKEVVDKGNIGDKINDTVGTIISETVKNPVFKNLIDSYLNTYIIKPLMNIETLSGEKLPTFKNATLTYKDTELFEQQRQHEKDNTSLGKLFNSLLIKDNPVIIGTGTKLELVNQNKNKSSSK